MYPNQVFKKWEGRFFGAVENSHLLHIYTVPSPGSNSSSVDEHVHTNLCLAVNPIACQHAIQADSAGR